MRIHLSIPGAGALMLAAALTFSSIAPAEAADDSAPGTVSRAERSIGISDDHISDAVSVLSSGQTFVGTGSVESLSFTVGDDNDRQRDAGVEYTVDQLDASSIRLASVFKSAETTRATWKFGSEVVLSPLADGRVSVTDADGDLVAGIESPWAVDAVGHRLETYFTADGADLTQHVVFTPKTQFPVVADPTIHFYPLYYTVALNHAESVTAVSTVAACAVLFSKSPFPAMKALSVGCGVFAAYGTPQLAGGHCLTVHVAGAPPALGTWWPTFPTC